MATRPVRSIATAAAAAALVMLSGCAQQAAPTNDATTTPGTSSAPFDLYTHCGIYEARVQDTFFVADQPLDDGHGNPPAGWGNPYQPGTITITGPKAVFHDTIGHTVTFHKRPDATNFLRTCS